MKKIIDRKFFDAYKVHKNGAHLMGLKPYNIFHFWYCWKIKWRSSLR